jgi:hypothetical protein
MHDSVSQNGQTEEKGYAEPLELSALYPRPYDILLGRIDEVLAEWRSLALTQVWSDLAPSRLMDSFPEILPRMFRLAAQGSSQIDPDLSELIGEAHGYFRRRDRIPLAAVAEEWNFVKRACWKVLQRASVDEATASAAMQRLDILCDDAIGFSLRGFYAPELNVLRGKGLERREGEDERRVNISNRRDTQ